MGLEGTVARRIRETVEEEVEIVTTRRKIVGSRVRILEGARKPQLRGLRGEVMATYGPPERRAAHVRLDDGRWQLLWLEDLEESAEADPV